MGFHKIDKCIFTGYDVTNVDDGDMRDAYEYIVNFTTHQVVIRLPDGAKNWADDEFFKTHKYIFEGLLLNNNWFDDNKLLITIDRLKELISQKSFPKTPQEKADVLFQQYLKLQVEDGQEVSAWNKVFFKQLYFKSNNELIYYTRHLIDQELIEASITDYIGDVSELHSFTITVKGLNYGIQLHTEGDKSNLCFIAMAFKDETKAIRTAIKEALIETGFQPILIDEQNINSDRTINDEIIANLKKCRFCIADFSFHSNGVYFESGFALGQGKKVIYTCQAEEFAKAHFDIRPLQHIIYDTTEQLKKDLIHKIEAWIK